MQSFKPVRWKEGLFLRPHHLQQFALYLESLEFSRLCALESHSWGLTKLAIDGDALDNYKLEVTELQLVMPDGAFIDVPGNARLSTVLFERFMSDSGRPVPVYLGVRAREERRPQVVEGSGGQGIGRFTPVEQEVYDLDAGDGRAPVEFLEYDLRCFFGEESQQGYDTLPLAQLVGVGDPAHPVVIDRTFAPPSLTLNGSAALREIVRNVLDRLGVVQREWGSNRHALQADKLVIYQAVSACQPVLRDMAHDGLVHPRRVYHEMARLTGALLAAAGRSADDVMPYDHRQPGPVFEHLRALIDKHTPSVIEKRFHRFPMPRTDGDFAVDLPAEVHQAGARCYIEALADQSTHELPKLRMAAKIGSAAQIETLQRFFLPGIPAEMLPGPPPELGADAKGTYFRLKQEHEDWNEHVIADGNLTVSWRDAPQDVELVLVVILPKA